MKKAQQELNELIGELRSRSFKYEPKDEKEIDWRAYSAAKMHEVNLFLIFIKEAVDSCEVEIKKSQGPGRPPGDQFDLAKIILMQNYFQTGERQAAGLAELFSEKLHLKGLPSPSSIGRAYERNDVQEILLRVFEITREPITDIETSFSADGTGLPRSIKQNYANDRDEHEKHAGYDKAIIMISNNFHIVTAFEHAKGTANDSPFLKPLLEQTAYSFHNMQDVELDASFISRENCTAISRVGATPYIFPKTGITLNQHGHPAWKLMLLDLLENPNVWLRAYHSRSNNECYFSAHKRRFSRPLLRRIMNRRATEEFCRVIVLNITMLIVASFERRVEVKYLEES